MLKNILSLLLYWGFLASAVPGNAYFEKSPEIYPGVPHFSMHHFHSGRWKAPKANRPNAVTQLDSVIALRINETNHQEKEKYCKEYFVYNTSNQLKHYIFSLWDKTAQKWGEYQKETYHYNFDGNLEKYILFKKSGEVWIPARKYDFLINNDETVIEISENANETSMASIASKKNVNNQPCEFHQTNNLDKLFTDESSSAVWEPVNKWIQYYNSGMLNRETQYSWNPVTETWDVKGRIIYKYLGERIQEIVKWTWSDSATAWVYAEKQSFLYSNITWQLISISGYLRNESLEKWQQTTLEGFIYDDDFNAEGHSIVAKEDGSNQWNVHLKNYCTYDYSINDVDIILPWENSSFLPSLFHHQITSEIVQTYNFEELLDVPLLERSYFYSSKDPNTSSENTKEADSIKVFPNPANDFVVVECPENASHMVFEIFDLTSSLIISARIMGRRTIDLSNLTNGIYLYQIKENGNISTGKLMVW
ncbi:T9SS type A sorting domain-containing protein [Marinilabilia salmonicolor]|uniref:Putative secreted protein (Por secretion system target) n=1 Tax=Marinilabilia salmonicolor TaxID=989 RepID=A0A368VE26_9BACT|nr:T9SS type A sorting domain-containing protein [Marinilabilia salmonicolor]RCW38963.1 putative secreted protein (Por secretion system target) [Marinilabilia salmonicolor]